MEVKSCSNTPNFKARHIANATTRFASYKILELDKVSDAVALEKLQQTFKKETILDRFPENGLLSVTYEFMNNLFKSVKNPNMRTFLTITEGKPSALMTVESSNPKKYMHVAYLAAWKPEGMLKPHYNGKVLIRHLFENARQNKTEAIDLIPGFRSKGFYEKLGFEKDGFDVCISNDRILDNIKNIDTTVNYEVLKNQPEIDLNVFV